MKEKTSIKSALKKRLNGEQLSEEEKQLLLHVLKALKGAVEYKKLAESDRKVLLEIERGLKSGELNQGRLIDLFCRAIELGKIIEHFFE